MGRSAHDGMAITADIAAPVIGPDGEPMRRKGGKIARSAHDTVPNPAARFVAPLTDHDPRKL